MDPIKITAQVLEEKGSVEVGKMELQGLVNDLKAELNNKTYHGKSVAISIFMPNHHFGGQEDKKKIAWMIVGELGGTIEASFSNLIAVKTHGTTSTSCSSLELAPGLTSWT
jgi:hypothetical protein